MKKLIILSIYTCYVLIGFAQEKSDLYILEADSTWLKEVIKFPLGFAPEINYNGYEDLRFAKDWRNADGNEFFTYAFVWNVNLKEIPSSEDLKYQMTLYYDGLMTAVNKDKDFDVPDTQIKIEKVTNEINSSRFLAEIKVYDAFVTKKTITLFATVEPIFCHKSSDFLLLFRVSTLNYTSEIWKDLNAVKLKEGYCEN